MAYPDIKIVPAPSDKIVEILSTAILIFFWIFLIYIYSGMPDMVPIHLDGYGKADGFANKTSLFIGPAISTVIYFGLTYLNKYPHIYNYPAEINEKNALRYYTNGARMIRYLKLSIIIVFMIVETEIVLIAKNINLGLGIWTLIIPMAIIFIPVIYFIIKFSFPKKS
jgi:uncharacterized membrane protein